MPIFCSSRTACGLSGFMTSATATMPSRLPVIAEEERWVFCPPPPAPPPACASARAPARRAQMKARLPPQSALPSSRRRQAVAGHSLEVRDLVRRDVPFLRVLQDRPRASGCSLLPLERIRERSSSSAATPSAGRMSVTFGSPDVIVPVLSRATISMRPVSSSDAAVLKSMPFFAPSPLPTMMATGVASPSAHGQEMTSTEMPRASAKPTSARG